jgi:hypothetical protein
MPVQNCPFLIQLCPALVSCQSILDNVWQIFRISKLIEKLKKSSEILEDV